MNKIIKQIGTHKVVRALASLKIAVTGLILIFVLTFWGTVAQVENGLYASQERYFSSLYFLAMGFLPFPGGQLVLWVLFVNMTCAFFTRLIYAGEKLGLIIIHSGLILFLIAAFVTLHGARESHLTLREGQSSNVSESYMDWEIALWPTSGKDSKTIQAIDVKKIINQTETIDLQGLKFITKTYYPNSQAFSAPFAGVKEKYLNASGLNVLKPQALNKERERNTPGLILQIENPDKTLVMLYGAEDDPTKIKIANRDYLISLRHQKFPLPLNVKLLDFTMEKHPGTAVARSYQSKVEIQHDGVSREMTISMNEPLRFKDFTFYQASYQIDNLGNEISTLAVVKNAGRVLPYIATFVTFFGLGLHFLLAAFKFRKRLNNA